MSATVDSRKGVCILSLDNGGPGSYSQLILLKEYMGRFATDLGIPEENIYPADYFDLIGGVGYGGLIAMMLGYFRMNVEEATEALIGIGQTIFSGNPDAEVDLERNSARLKNAVESMLRSRGVPVNTKLREQSSPSTGCNVVLYATSTDNICHSYAFRTYPSRGSSLNPTIVEAICATMSNPSVFLPVKFGPRSRQQSFAGSAMGANNPTREMLQEAGVVFGKESRVAQIISLGSGMSRIPSLKTAYEAGDVYTLLKEMSADCEVVEKELATRLLNVNAYLRLNVNRGMERVYMTNWMELGPIESHTRAYVETAAVTSAIEASLRNLTERVGTITLAQLNYSSNVRVIAKKVPDLSPYYVMRKKESDLMVHHLITSLHHRQRIFPITGMGGCGKTQIVSYFLQEYSSLYKQVVFVDASSLSSIKADFQEWAQSLGDGHDRDVWEDAIRHLERSLDNNQSALILDNADNLDLDLVPFLPQNKSLTIIITSRNRNVANLSTTYHLELGGMKDDEALSTLLHAARRRLPLSPEEMASAQTLMSELGNLAVALVQVGTYCHELSSTILGVLQPYNFAQYLTLFKSHRAELLKQAGPSTLDHYQRGVYTTLDLSYKAIPRLSREVFHVLSFFYHTSIPVAAIAAATDRAFRDPCSYLPRPESHAEVVVELTSMLCVEGRWSDFQMQEIIRTLRSFSLLTTTSLNDSVFLHIYPLVQSWSRDMNPSYSQHYRAMAMQVITACARRSNQVQIYRYLLPHIIDLVTQLKGQTLHVNDLMAAGEMLRDQGHYQMATGLFELSFKIMKESDEAEYKGKSSVISRLAAAYWDLGRLNEAEKLEIEVLEQWRKSLGNENKHTIGAAANLAATYREQGRWNEAEALELEVLEQRRKSLGNEHKYTIRAAANLVATYCYQGRWREAERLALEVLGQRSRALGPEHPETMAAAADLATIYREQGRWSEAETLGVEVLEKRRGILGMEHPHTVWTAGNLAATYHSQGRLSEAELLGKEVLKQRRKILGQEHPHTILAAARLASVHVSQNQLDEALHLLAPAVQLCLKTMGQQHPDTQSRVRDLVSLYALLGKAEEAQRTKNLLLL